MRRNLVLIAVVTVFSLFMDTAGAACKVIPAKKWTGRIAYTGQSPDVTENYFIGNGCDWADHEAEFNGVDAVVFEVSRYAGLSAKMSWSHAGEGTGIHQISAEFRGKDCQPVISGQWTMSGDQSSAAFRFPASAKWVIVKAATGLGAATDIEVTISSPGKKCPKKKKRRR